MFFFRRMFVEQLSLGCPTGESTVKVRYSG